MNRIGQYRKRVRVNHISSCNPPTMRNRATMKLLEFTIKYSYYIGGTPFYWRRGQVELVHNDSIRWILSLLISFCFTFLILSTTVMEIMSTTRHAHGMPKDVENLMHSLAIIGSLSSTLLHLNLVIKRKEIAVTMNQCLRLMHRLQERRPDPSNAELVLILSTVLLLSVCTPLLSLSMYWTSGDFYIWLTNSESEARALALRITSNVIQLILQWYFITTTCAVCLVYLVLTYPFLYFGSEHFRQLLCEDVPLLLPSFVHNYRSFQLLLTCSCFHYALPLHLVIFTTACIISLNALIRVSMAFGQFAFLLTIISGYVLHMLTGFKEASLLPQLTGLFFSRVNNNLLSRRYMCSFPPLGVGFGSFGRLDKKMYTWVVSTCISFAVSFVLIK